MLQAELDSMKECHKSTKHATHHSEKENTIRSAL